MGSPSGGWGPPGPRPLSLRPLGVLSGGGLHLARPRGASSRARTSWLELDEVDIGGDPALEARYRESLPVVEIDGERAFTYFVEPGALRRKLAQTRATGGTL